MKILHIGKNARRIKFDNPAESVRWVAQMNERHHEFAAAAKLYREIGDTEAAERCEKRSANPPAP